MPMDSADNRWAGSDAIADVPTAAAATAADNATAINAILAALRESSIISEA